MKSKLKVFYGINESGTAYWRGKIPAKALIRKNLCDVRLMSIFKHHGEEVEEMLLSSDVAFMQSPCGIECTLEYVKLFQLGIASIADFDDNLFDCHPLNPGYATLGLHDVDITLPDGSKESLWKNERMGFSIKDNAKRFCSFIDTLLVANTITTTTNYLKNELVEASAKDSNDFRVIPNAIDFSTFKPFGQRRLDHSKLRIGWTSSDSHVLEGNMVMRIINELYKRRSDFTFVILGNVEKLRKVAGVFPVEWHQFVPLEVYPLKLASLEFDIGICPLEDHSFNKSKSALKWSEYASMRYPSVCSNIEPYWCVKNGIDGLLASNVDQFVDQICLLMDNEQKRRSVANAAYERNREDFNIDTVCESWLETFERAYFRESSRELSYKGKPLERIKTPSYQEVSK